MQTVKQAVSLPISNFDLISGDDRTCQSRHGPLFPSSIRAIICGPSGCGKTNIMLSLLCAPNGLRFFNVYLFSKSLNQPKYKLLKEALSRVKGMSYHSFSENDAVVDPADAKEHSVFIFDEWLAINKTKSELILQWADTRAWTPFI